MKRYLWLALLMLLGLVGCRSVPQFKNHPQPELTVDFSPFEDIGCPSDQYGFRSCNSESPLAALGCDRIEKPSDLLGGLEPSYPITRCLVEPYRNTDEPGKANAAMIAEGRYFYNAGGIWPVYIRYVILRDEEFQSIETEEEFRATFAPIESAEEALSYVLAVKNLHAAYGLEYDPKYVYFVDTVGDTHVETLPDGYLVHLFHAQVFGCGPHPISAVDLHISTQGIIEETRMEPIYKDPAQDNLCID